MFTRRMKIWLVIMIAAFLIYAEMGQERTLAHRYIASGERVSDGEETIYAVRINGSDVFTFPEKALGDRPLRQVEAIAERINQLLRESIGPVSVKPDLANDKVTIRMGEQLILAIEDQLAQELESTTTEVAMEWVDNLSSAISDVGANAQRSFMQRNRARLESGRASWYGGSFHGRRTANGETFDKEALTAAHRTLPFGTVVLVTNATNGRSVIVRINDRGPFSPGRHIDLSKRAAEDIGMIRSGTAPVEIEILTAPSSVARN